VCPCELKTGGPYAFINGVGSDFDFGGLCGVAINIESAYEHLLKKKDSCEPDGMYLSELPSYLIHNKVLLIKNIKMGNFRFSLAEKEKY
jgi:hypothetical protein